MCVAFKALVSCNNLRGRFHLQIQKLAPPGFFIPPCFQQTKKSTQICPLLTPTCFLQNYTHHCPNVGTLSSSRIEGGNKNPSKNVFGYIGPFLKGVERGPKIYFYHPVTCSINCGLILDQKGCKTMLFFHNLKMCQELEFLNPPSVWFRKCGFFNSVCDPFLPLRKFKGAVGGWQGSKTQTSLCI